jgi:ABC-type sugar transport system substrate-binding protein
LIDYAAKEGYLKKGTKTTILRGVDATFHSEGRTEGFNTKLAAIGAEIIDSQTANYITSQALPIVESWLISNPEIECIFSCNDDMALGALEAMKLANRDDIKVFGIDANELGCLALKDGSLAATVAQDTIGYSHLPADYAATLINGGKVESVRLDSKLILKDDVNEILKTIHGYTDAQIAALDKK